MTVKTSELSGMALCYAVCMIEMPHLVWNKTIGIHHASDQIVVPELPEPKCYSPFTGWAMFGPIIERERIDLFTEKDTPEAWFASIARHQNGERLTGWRLHQYGPTPLVAAMRVYVASKLGDEVEIPEELQ